jgi:hypothetical protein
MKRNIILLLLFILFLPYISIDLYAADNVPPRPTFKNSFSPDQGPKVRINVKDSRFGARGDGKTIDNIAVQKAIDYARRQGGGVVYFPKGIYILYGINLPPNISLLGEGHRESVLKAPDRVDLLVKNKFWRMFKTQTAGRAYIYESDKDSGPLSFQNLTVDYNGPNQIGWFDGINAEQNFCIELGASAKKPGRLRAVFDNCEIRHSVTDGISVVNNVDCTVTNCLFKTNRRGSICLLGGHSITRAKNFKVLADPKYCIALQSEVCVKGYGNTLRSDFYIEDAYVEGGIDLGMEPYKPEGSGGTIISLKNIDASKGDYIFSSHGASFTVENCQLGCLGGWWLMPEKATFNNCQFILRQKKDGKFPEACVRIMWNQGPTAWKNQVLTFNNCTFTAEDTVLGYEGPTAAFNIVLFEKFSNNNKLIVNGGRVTDKLRHVITSNYGGMATMKFKNLEVNSKDIAFKLAGGSGDGRYDITLDNIKFMNGKFARLYPSHRDCTINYHNIVMDEKINWIQSFNWSMSVTLRGTRTIIGTDPPTSNTHGLIGDIYQLKADSNRKWQCIANSFWSEWYKSNTSGSSIWNPL